MFTEHASAYKDLAPFYQNAKVIAFKQIAHVMRCRSKHINCILFIYTGPQI